MSELEGLMEAFADAGGDKAILVNKEIAHLVASGHKILSTRDIDGLEVLGQIIGINNKIPIIINTAYSNYRDNYMSWAAEYYVVKSSDLTELKEKVHELLN